jgi:uncharacterized membrane protein
MPKKLDYTAVWADAVALLQSHREAVVAIAGFFLFAVTWAFAFLLPGPELDGVETLTQMTEILRTYFIANWMFIIPVSFIGSYGGFVIYVLLGGQNLAKVGDALTDALSRFLPYFIASLLTGWLTLLGFAIFLVPGLYLVARFVVLPAVMAANPQSGILDAIKTSWAVTAGVGWVTFVLLFVVALVTWVISTVANLLIGLLCVLAAGPEGIPLIETGIAALFSTAQGVIVIALTVAIYRQLKPQTPS